MPDRGQRAYRDSLSRVDIEARVSRMVDVLLPLRGNDPLPPDLQMVVKVLALDYHVRFSYSDELGHGPSGGRILGMFTVDPLTILVSSVLPPWSPGFRRTLAHELGHLALHRNLIGGGRMISVDKPVPDTAKQLRYREAAQWSDLEWVEWQANEFAMGLILPRRFLQSLVFEAQHELGIRHNLGTLYLDDQPCNKLDSHRVVQAIALRSGFKMPLLWRRLRHLRILEDHQQRRVRPIVNSLDTLFEEED